MKALIKSYALVMIVGLCITGVAAADDLAQGGFVSMPRDNGAMGSLRAGTVSKGTAGERALSPYQKQAMFDQGVLMLSDLKRRIKAAQTDEERNALLAQKKQLEHEMIELKQG